MSIAEREAENAGPECAFQRLRLDMDDVRDAYIAGRTAEPCKEQIEAVAKTLAVVAAYTTEDGYCYLSRIDKALEEGEDHWSYISGNRRDDLMAIAKRLLDAARKAVM